MLDLIAVIVVVVSLVATLGNVGYLALLNSAANKRGASGAPVATYVRSRWPIAGGATAGAVLAWLLSNGSGFADILAILVGAGAAGLAGNSLAATKERYRSGG